MTHWMTKIRSETPQEAWQHWAMANTHLILGSEFLYYIKFIKFSTGVVGYNHRQVVTYNHLQVVTYNILDPAKK